MTPPSPSTPADCSMPGAASGPPNDGAPGPSYGVLTVCLNAEQTLQRCIDSVLRQSPLPCHYVFVDGGSSDASVDIIEHNRERAEKQGVRLDLLQQEPPAPDAAGIPSAWNQGLRVLVGDLVYILNADDWYEPDAARQVGEAFRDHPDAGIVVSPVGLRESPEAPVARVLRPRSLSLLPVLMPLPHPGCFVRREVYEVVGKYDEHYAISADYDFIFRCHRAGVVIRVLERPLVGMGMGGLAARRRRVARKETLDIGLRHCRWRAAPRLAYILRCWLGR